MPHSRAANPGDARVLADLAATTSNAGSGSGHDHEAPLVRLLRLECDVAERLAEPQLALARQRLAGAAVALERIDVEGIEAEAALAGLEKTLGRAHEALDAVAEDGTGEQYHEWRKRCKYHWYHLRSLARLLPDELAERREQFKRIGKLVGRAHDRCVLLERIESSPDFLRQAPSTRRVRRDAIRQRRGLRLRALELSAGLFDRRPRETTAAVADSWQ